ncbi:MULTISPECIES: SIMPL domain-containing protein [unclassified Acinetobacter]|uniref:SIMPL domain-containing protein n=1 Tax=unclassified Acinetobacter TaxID=196816 RepID=UPI0015D37D7F|nr:MULTISPECIES: SIMPL domain-containing protein [unclassified Acinetobacter]UUS61904.1 SIMPL domain-containing protein [Acinetobacter sp. YH16056_T]
MRKIILSTVLLASGLGLAAATQAADPLNYNIVNIQADATRQVSNDQMHAVLYIEKSNKQPAELATQINQLMTQAVNTARKYPAVKIETGSQSTYPIYDNDSRKLKEWRGRAEVRLESTDFKAASQLVSELQQNFQTQSISFSVSDAQRKKVENELMVEVSKNFQQRAQSLAQAWNKSGYNLVNINLNASNYGGQPVPRMAMMKAASADAIPEQEMAGGESKITVSANGSIQFK